MPDYLLHEDGFKIILEDGLGFLLLEEQPPAIPPVNITPAPAVAAGVTVLGSVRKGSMSITPAVAVAAGVTVGPTVDISAPTGDSVSITPAPAVAAGVTIAPTVNYSSVNITPVPAEAASDGSVTVEYEQVFFPSVNITPGPAVAEGLTLISQVVQRIGYLFSPEMSIAIIWTPQDPREE